ncbi:histidine acid phosphatase family protein [Stylonychia lemnae]|uniref:Histidine acid phosphatase family protein n=1 Tax=Stylonychia lemnae TaxID=5949 RepID=A0A078AV72_STYLE|nr:histidine acid phosphatase family protein [Stylonychia lemnae]|eukprot:CDW85891.1 histidine acid phosphatase family protein [Stylonychia lemnae]
MRKIILSLSFILSATYVQSGQKLAFVYELVRHGARASTHSEDLSIFEVPKGQLTRSGMRQRYLIGKYNRQKYIEKEQLIDGTYNPSQIYLQTTSVTRAQQSSYAEMMGLFPPLQNSQLNEQIPSKAMPKLKLHNKGNLQETVLKSQIDNYQFIPAFTYAEANVNDDLYFTGCPWVYAYKTDAAKKPETYNGVIDEVLDVLRNPIGKANNYTQDQIDKINFNDITLEQDKWFTTDFQGVKQWYQYTPVELEYLKHFQVIHLTLPVGQQGRQLLMTKQLSKPIQSMKNRIQEILSGNQSKDTLRYIVYSGHDDTISNLLVFLNPVNFYFEAVPYCSQVYFELYYDEDCVSTKKDNSCFTLQMFYNGHPFKLDTCQAANLQRGSNSPFCQFDDFVAHYDKLKYQGDVKEACLKPYTG